MNYNVIGFGLLVIASLVVTQVVANRPDRWYPARLLLGAVALRAVGALTRYEVLFGFYGGTGDAVMYYREGLELAGLMWGAGVSPFSLVFWAGGQQWWGSAFLVKMSGLVLSFIGSTMRGEFLIFSLFSFGGLYAIAVAFKNTQPSSQAVRYATWIWLWPSLWFWPSSVGKEAVILLAIGLATLGYTGRGRGISWPLFLMGLGLAFCIRPHVTAVLAMAAVAAQWLGTWRHFGIRRVVESVAAVALAALAFSGMKAQFGLAQADLEGMREFVQYRAGQTLQGGSNIGGVPLAAAGIPFAFINVWARPFPWDVHNATSAFAAAEILVFWWLLWRRRKGLRLALRYWRRDRLLRFGVPLVALYTLMIGLTFGNLGIIARQRAPMFPFMLMILLAIPAPVWATQRRRSRLAGKGLPALQYRALGVVHTRDTLQSSAHAGATACRPHVLTELRL